MMANPPLPVILYPPDIPNIVNAPPIVFVVAQHLIASILCQLPGHVRLRFPTSVTASAELNCESKAMGPPLNAIHINLGLFYF